MKKLRKEGNEKWKKVSRDGGKRGGREERKEQIHDRTMKDKRSDFPIYFSDTNLISVKVQGEEKDTKQKKQTKKTPVLYT